jgi:hypothetical protein
MRVTSWFAVVALAALAVPAQAQTSVNRTVDFEFDRWFDLNVKEGPVTLHRLRLEREGSGLRDKIAGGGEFKVGVKVQLEYSNEASRDWDANFHVVWMDDSGEPIDGYTSTEELEENKKFERAGGSVTTVKYGLARAKKLKIVVNVKPD